MNPKYRETGLTFSVTEGQTGQFLVSRMHGAQARARLEHLLETTTSAGQLAIDFHDVEAMTNSYADELIGKFYVSLAAGDVAASRVLLVGLNEETRDAITICLERRKLAALDGDEDVLLGQAAAIEDTYAQARSLGEFKASALAEAMGITLTNANNRLKRLVEAGAIQRERADSPERGGKEFTYRVSSTSSVMR